MDPVGDSTSYHTMVCPACNHAWFHRRCIQEMAIHTDNHFIKCPVCRNRMQFCAEMSNMGIRGIRVPFRGPIWENNNSSALLRERCWRCTVSECHYPRGRERAEGQGPWQLLLCRSCAAEGTHRRCSNLTDSAGTWECASCAGVGTSSQAALWPLQGILVTDRTGQRERRMTRRHVVWAPDTFNQPRGHHETSAERSTRSPNCEAAPGTFRHSMVPKGRLPPSQRGRARTRSRSPLRQATNTHSRPRRQRGSRRAASPCAQSSSSSSSSDSETASGSSSD
ncbi:PHF7 protein, partial [Asarcornis scutulata]|nr:PHF7 protein [Asarcornis scutulata]